LPQDGGTIRKIPRWPRPFYSQTSWVLHASPDGSPSCPRLKLIEELCNLKGVHHMSIWTILFIILLIAWIGGFTVFHVAGGLIHLLLVFAVISLILHFVLGRRAA
jgi:hypothetical protein